MLTFDLMTQVRMSFTYLRMSRELAFGQRQHPRQVHWLLGYAIKALTLHLHPLEPIIRKGFCCALTCVCSLYMLLKTLLIFHKSK